MYLGYLEMKDTMYYNPGGIFWNKEVLVSSDFLLLNRHFYIDLLLGHDDYNSDSFEHLHPQDILSLKHLDKQLQDTGYVEKVFRMLCHCNENEPAKWLIVLTKIYPFVTQFGKLVLVTYSWPFATLTGSSSVENLTEITEELEFIKNNEAWLSLIPSFYNPPSDQLSLSGGRTTRLKPHFYLLTTICTIYGSLEIV